MNRKVALIAAALVVFLMVTGEAHEFNVLGRKVPPTVATTEKSAGGKPDAVIITPCQEGYIWVDNQCKLEYM